MIFPNQQCEENLYSQGYNRIAGVDEAGRGAWAGPIVAAAVIMPRDFYLGGICDSKMLREERREELAFEIKKIALAWAVGVIDIGYINQYNIGSANRKAIEEAVKNLRVKPDYAVIDGVCGGKKGNGDEQGYAHGKPHTGHPLKREGVCVFEYIKDGDAAVYSIAAASIIAKVARDRILKKEHLKFPCYGFDKNKGYGTKFHQEALIKNGICEIHRILYKPIRRIMEGE
ncbi:ribonuclease HII [Candidatus Falkowbacteria bacterium RBG_13_39_14]|uniref:Ribonuclease HII n=1 Tax=Candidatus Falkowbacteria bacterium RBG_13_39_14 TaxID=1797985 RepID=A0A1F5S5E3_9BACT|nr:MAG: ribonuclease HII [Candidatus Falkowbacteria bacterium RBG_13_39_14]